MDKDTPCRVTIDENNYQRWLEQEPVDEENFRRSCKMTDAKYKEDHSNVIEFLEATSAILTDLYEEK